MGGGPVQGTQYVFPGGGQVVDRAGLDVTDPQGEPGWRRQRLDVAAVLVGLSRISQVDLLAFHAGGLLAAAICGEDLAVQDQVGHALVFGSL